MARRDDAVMDQQRRPRMQAQSRAALDVGHELRFARRPSTGGMVLILSPAPTCETARFGKITPATDLAHLLGRIRILNS